MRNKFSEWISQGIASWKHADRTHTCPVCDPEDTMMIRTYNNIWGMPTDTQMAKLDDGRLVITGRFACSKNWMDFCESSHWGGIDFTTAPGIWSLHSWLFSFKKELKQTDVNGECAWEVVDRVEPQNKMTAVNVTTSESKIPQFVNMLENHQVGSIQELLNIGGTAEDICERFNESLRVKGNNWCLFNRDGEYKLGCRIGGTNYFVNLIENK